MSTTGPSDQGESRPQTPLDQINVACDDFDAAWKSGQRPRIEDVIGQRPETGRRKLFFELLRVELEWRSLPPRGGSPLA